MRAAALLLLVTFLAPIAIAQEEDGSHLVVTVDGWWITPRGTDLDYAFVDIGGLASGGEVRTLDHEQSLIPVFYAGWQLASAPSTRLGIRFWEYDDGAGSATGVLPQDVGPLLASPTLLASVNFFGFLTADSATAESRMRATVIEGGADWSHAIGSNGTFRFDAGARIFRYERESDVIYTEDPNKVLLVRESTDARGIGPRAAVGYDHRFGRVTFGGQLGFALPIGEIEGSNLQDFLVDGSSDVAAEVRQPETTDAFVQLDGELRLSVAIRGGWSASARYAFQYWSDVRQTFRFVAAGTATAVPEEDDVVFSGLLVGLRYEF